LTVVPTESWTIEQIDLLKRLWSEGLTAAAIAARLDGLSRSAVLGKVHRLRLRTDKAAAASAAKAKPAGQGSAETAPARRRRGGQRRKHPQTAPTAVRQHKTLFELTNKTCRWIVEATFKWAAAWAWSHLH
jgi:GcrA cell cycle regulator